jgi:hypothetical protein
MTLATVQSVLSVLVVLVGIALFASAVRGVAGLDPPLETATTQAPALGSAIDDHDPARGRRGSGPRRAPCPGAGQWSRGRVSGRPNQLNTAASKVTISAIAPSAMRSTSSASAE